MAVAQYGVASKLGALWGSPCSAINFFGAYALQALAQQSNEKGRMYHTHPKPSLKRPAEFDLYCDHANEYLLYMLFSVYYPEGPSTQHLVSPITIPLMVVGTRDLKHWVLGPSGLESKETQDALATQRDPPRRAGSKGIRDLRVLWHAFLGAILSGAART